MYNPRFRCASASSPRAPADPAARVPGRPPPGRARSRARSSSSTRAAARRPTVRRDPLRRGGARGAQATTTPVVMKGKSFVPRVVVVPVGGPVQFPTEDPIFHNAFSVSGENRLDSGAVQAPEGCRGRSRFQHPGIVKVYCNIHPQMSAAVGRARQPALHQGRRGRDAPPMENVPAGKYVVKAWHERGGEAGSEVAGDGSRHHPGPLHPGRVDLRVGPSQEQVREGLLHEREVLGLLNRSEDPCCSRARW